MYFVYVNNEVEAIKLLQDVLHRVDHNRLLIAVPNGYDLIQFLQNVKTADAYPDLIILTTKFSRLAGKEVLQLLKTDDIYRLIPVVMLLQESNDDDETFCRKLGTDTIVTPVMKKDWIDTAKKICAAGV